MHGMRDRYGMKTFTTWLERRHRQPEPLVPECGRIIQMILAAGPSGISHSELLGSSELEREVVDALLQGLYALGMVSVTGAGLGRVYRYCCRLA